MLLMSTVDCANTLHCELIPKPYARRTIFNGNGKLPWELRLAVEQGVLVNVDSEFDLDNIAAAAEAAGKTARVLIRINPDVDPEVPAFRAAGSCGAASSGPTVPLEMARSSGPAAAHV